MIKGAYFGGTKYSAEDRRKRMMIKPSEKHKQTFQFEWDPSEDTSLAKSDIKFYREKKDPMLMFGKGQLGGLDKIYKGTSSRMLGDSSGAVGQTESRSALLESLSLS